MFGFKIFLLPFDLRSESVPQRGMIFPLLQVERKTRIGNGSRALLAQKVFCCCEGALKQKTFLPLDRLTRFLSFKPERFGCPAGLKVRRLALFYDSEGKREKSTIKAAVAGCSPFVFYSFDLSIF
jgi:hypothetical protein